MLAFDEKAAQDAKENHKYLFRFELIGKHAGVSNIAFAGAISIEQKNELMEMYQRWLNSQTI